MLYGTGMKGTCWHEIHAECWLFCRSLECQGTNIEDGPLFLQHIALPDLRREMNAAAPAVSTRNQVVDV